MDSLRRLTSSVFDGSRLGGGRRGHDASPQDPVELTCITDRLMVSGFPVAGASDKKANESNVDDLVAYLDATHGKQYLLFTLNTLEDEATTVALKASQQHSDGDPVTIAEKLHEQLLEFNWERDGMKAHTPPLDLTFRICYAIFAWLALDAANVAVVNCHTGKTRSGVVVACYLLFARLADDPMEAFAEFYRKRWDMRSLTPQALCKKTPPSIQRFLTSFQDVIELQKPRNSKPLLLKAIILRALPVEMQPCIQIWDDYKMIFCTDTVVASSSRPDIDWNGDDGFLAILWENGIDLDGGFSILCSFGDEYNNDGDEEMDASSRVLFRYADSTWFLSPGLITLTKSKLDLMKQYEHGFDEEQFSIDLVLHENHTKARKNYVRVDYTGNNAVRQGLIEITKHHRVLPDPAMHSNFIRMGFSETAITFALQRSQNAPNVALDLLHSEGLAVCFPQDLAKEEECSSTTNTTNSMPAGEQMAMPPPLRRQTTAEIVAMQSLRSRYAIPTAGDCSTCHTCKDDDYMMRPQIVRCTGRCGNYYHTTCVGLRKIPFGLTTLNDRTNHAAYVKKFFSAWECDICAPPPAISSTSSKILQEVPADSTVVPRAWVDKVMASQVNSTTDATEKLEQDSVDKSPNTPLQVIITPPVPFNFDLFTESPLISPEKPENTADKLDRLKEFLQASGVSVEDLLRAATTPNVSIAPSPKTSNTGSESNRTNSFTNVALATASLSPAVGEVLTGTFENPRSHIVTQANVEINGAPQVIANSPSKPPLHTNASAVIFKSSPSPNLRTQNNNVSSSSPVQAMDINSKLMAQLRAAKSLPQESEILPVVPIEIEQNEPSKYDMMLKRGVPFEAVQNCMTKDGMDPSTLRQPEITSPLVVDVPIIEATKNQVRLGDMDEFKGYFRMLRLGCPREAVKQKLIMDGMDPVILDMGPDAIYEEVQDRIANINPVSSLQDDIKSVRAPTEDNETIDTSQPVENALLQDQENLGRDAPEQLSESSSELQLKDDPQYGKYFKMLQMGLPLEAVQHKMMQDGTDIRALVLGPDALVSALTQQVQKVGVKLKDEPTYGKYFKMLAMGLPEGAVRHKMMQEGVDPHILELGPDAMVSHLSKPIEPEGVKLKDDPVYSKYFKMLKMGLPDGAVRHKMVQEGVDPRALDLGPDAFVSQLSPSGTTTDKASVKPKPRRKKLHWQPISEDRLSSIHQQTIWEDKGDDALDIDMDMDELETLFFVNNETKKKASQPQGKPLKRKQRVTLIDGKRAMNAAISLARVKLSYSEISEAVRLFDAKGLTMEQLVGINEFLPTSEEASVVSGYIGDENMLGEVRTNYLFVRTTICLSVFTHIIWALITRRRNSCEKSSRSLATHRVWSAWFINWRFLHVVENYCSL